MQDLRCLMLLDAEKYSGTLKDQEQELSEASGIGQGPRQA